MKRIFPAEGIIVIQPEQIKAGGTVEYVSERKQEIGKVIAVGKAKWFDNGKLRPKPLLIRKGDIVAYRRFGKDALWLEGQEYLFVDFNDVLGKIR